MPSVSNKLMIQRPKKISPNSNTPLVTEKELLTTIPTSISYSTQSHYDFFNHGKSRAPSKILHWENFTDMVKNLVLDDISQKYEKPSTPLLHAPLSNKQELIQIIDTQVIRTLTSKLNHDDLELCRLSENSLIDWNLINNYNQILSSIAVRSHRVLRKQVDDTIKAYQQNSGDFADNVNEVYDYMCEFGLRYSVLTTYEFTWYLNRPENDPSTLFISQPQQNDSNDPTILQSWNYLFHLSKNDSLLAACPTVLPSIRDIDNSSNVDYFYDQSRYSYPSVDNFPASSTFDYRKRPPSGEEDDHEIKKFRREGSSSSHATDFGIMNWNNVIIKNEIGGDPSKGIVYLAEYNDGQLALKSTDGNDWRKVDLEKEARIYKRLSTIQGIHVPRMIYNGLTLHGEKYVLATEYIKQTSKLSHRHREEALKAIKAIHSLGVIHNDISESNFIVERDNNNEERVLVIDFRLSKDFKEEQRVHLTSYHIYMEKEKEKVEELFNNLF